MHLLIGYGTRPEYIKLLPVIKALSKAKLIEVTVLYTGQHEDIVPKDIAHTKLLYVADEEKQNDNRLDMIVRHILKAGHIYKGVTHMMVQGDTTSAFTLALGAFHREIPVIHLEAGLRTYEDTPFPEEFNRTAISKMADINFCATNTNRHNLLVEGVKPDRIFVVGNTILDNLVGIETSYSNTVIITLHRRENWDKIPFYFEEINKLAEQHQALRILMPLHPNPLIQQYKGILTAKNIDVVPPIPYDSFLQELANCQFIVSDSGGMQEEASFFKKKIIICRDFTERPEVLGTFGYLCKDPKDLALFFNGLSSQYITNEPCPYGDGTSSNQIVTILREYEKQEK